MDDIIIPKHAADSLQDDGLTMDNVFTVVGDYDDRIERTVDGRTEYGRTLEDGRYVVVVIEHDGLTMVTAWQDKRRSRRQNRGTRQWN